MSEWISPAACHAREAVAQVPGLRGLVLAGGEERDQVQQGEGAAGRRAARPDSPMPRSARIVGGLLVVELGELGLDARGDRDRPRASWAAACAAIVGRHRVVALVDVGDEEHRLGGQRVDVAHDLRRVLGRRHRARRAARLQRRDDLLAASASSATAALSPPRASRVTRAEAALGLLEVGVDQLGLDRLDVAQRVDRALGVDDVRRRGARGRRGRSRRSRGCSPGTGCRAPRPCARRATRPAMSWKSIVS